jgi:hypothetical protein
MIRQMGQDARHGNRRYLGAVLEELVPATDWRTDQESRRPTPIAARIVSASPDTTG